MVKHTRMVKRCTTHASKATHWLVIAKEHANKVQQSGRGLYLLVIVSTVYSFFLHVALVIKVVVS